MKLVAAELKRRAMVEHRYSTRTQRAYADWIRRFIAFHRRRHPQDIDVADSAARRLLKKRPCSLRSLAAYMIMPRSRTQFRWADR